jgi:hypothetical protein
MSKEVRWWQFKKKKELYNQQELEYYLRHKQELEKLSERIKNGKREGIYRKIKSGESSNSK